MDKNECYDMQATAAFSLRDKIEASVNLTAKVARPSASYQSDDPRVPVKKRNVYTTIRLDE
jgi:hypothetical protein